MNISELFNNFLTVSNQVLVLFFLIAIGYFCGKKKIFNDDTADRLSTIALYFSTPATIIASFVRPFESTMLTNLLYAFLLAIILHLVAIAVSFLIRSKDLSAQKVARFAVIFSNANFMALPLQIALLNADGAFYGSAYVVIFNIVVWTVGLLIMGKKGEKLTLKKLIFNPGVISVIVGLAIFLLNIHSYIPSSLTTTVQSIANLNTPIPMLIIGYHLSKLNLLKAVCDKRIYFPLFLRLLLIPTISLLLLMVGRFDYSISIAFIIAVACPVAATTTMFTVKFKRDTDLSVKLVSLTTLFSIITLPLFVAFAQFLLK